MGITAGISTGIEGISLLTYTYQRLSREFNNDLKWVSQSIVALQDEVDSLASVVLQNIRALDLLTTEKGGTCHFLNEECCFYTNKFGVVRNMTWELQACINKRRQQLANSWFTTSFNDCNYIYNMSIKCSFSTTV
jgi:hypothetical protein